MRSMDGCTNRLDDRRSPIGIQSPCTKEFDRQVQLGLAQPLYEVEERVTDDERVSDGGASQNSSLGMDAE